MFLSHSVLRMTFHLLKNVMDLACLCSQVRGPESPVIHVMSCFLCVTFKGHMSYFFTQLNIKILLLKLGAKPWSV